MQTNEAVDRSIDRLAPGAFSLEGMRDRVEWQRTRVQFEQALARMNGGSGGARVGGTVRVELALGSTTTPVNVASQDDADALIGMLQGLQTASTRTTR